MTVLEERVGLNLDDLHAILIPLRWMDCGGSSLLDIQLSKYTVV